MDYPKLIVFNQMEEFISIQMVILCVSVAVVVAFFVCWAPFHAQRLMTLYIKNWTTELHEIHSHLFYVSGKVARNASLYTQKNN